MVYRNVESLNHQLFLTPGTTTKLEQLTLKWPTKKLTNLTITSNYSSSVDNEALRKDNSGSSCDGYRFSSDSGKRVINDNNMKFTKSSNGVKYGSQNFVKPKRRHD